MTSVIEDHERQKPNLNPPGQRQDAEEESVAGGSSTTKTDNTKTDNKIFQKDELQKESSSAETLGREESSDDDDGDIEAPPAGAEATTVAAVKSSSAPPAKLPIMGGAYSHHEAIFVLSAGALLSFNSGYVNGSCLSGLLTPHHVTRSVAGFTGAYTMSALNLADGNGADVATGIGMIFSFMFGSCITGFLTPKATAYRIEPTYGPTFLLGGTCLLIASLFAATEHDESMFFNLCAIANGIQNGISSSYSANLIRSTHLTGTTTDIGLFLGQALRGNFTNSWKLLVLILLAVSFWFGGFVSLYATRYFTSYSLLFNAGLFLSIGMALVVFLSYEMHISLLSACFGTWQWKRAMNKLHLSLRLENHMSGVNGQRNTTKSQQLIDFFDVIDVDGNGEIEEEELMVALQVAGIKMSSREIKVMMHQADTDNDGTINRQEWEKIASACLKEK